jgi:hypothetical protein
VSLRDSLDLIRMVRPEAGTTALDNEIMAERASSLGAAEKRVIAAMAALKATDTDRTTIARQRVWEYFVQRELVGFRRHADVIAELGITAEVLNGLGIAPVRPQK